MFIVLDAGRPLAGGARFALDDGRAFAAGAGEPVDEIAIGRGEQREAALSNDDGVKRLTVRLPSPLLSRVHVRLRRAAHGWLFEDAHSRNGTFLNGQRAATGLVGADDVLEVGHTFLMIRAFPQRPGEVVPALTGADLDGRPVALQTLVPVLASQLRDLERVARSTVPVLLTGETGTGKEVLARAIHELSGRKGSFVAVNCGTLTEGLAESQLFGHVRGAFSGAVADAVGFVRAAAAGTLLLDEVGDLGRTAQAALLRVLQEREVVPVGRARPQTVDLRFVATTPRPLDGAVGRDEFRSDLFARLSGFVHRMTPLRERREDLGLLVAALLRKAGVRESDGARITPEMALALLRHDWPLNVRELEQLLVRSWLLNDDGTMNATVASRAPKKAKGSRPEQEQEQEQALRERLVETLRAAKGNVSAAARAAGEGRVQMHRLMRRLRIDPRAFRR
jgi:transcriptional regulator of acetoin/glycerol metabolism